MESASQRELTRKGSRFWILMGCFSLILVETVQNYMIRVDVMLPWGWGYALRYALVEFVFWAGMTVLIVGWADRFPAEAENKGRHIGILLSLTLATLVMHAAYRAPFHRLVYPESNSGSLWREVPFYLLGNGIVDACIFWAIVAICQALRSGHRSQEREQELARAQLGVLKAEALAREARLQALRCQLNPHFLFNTLNAISTLVIKGESAPANQMLIQLADFLRSTLEGLTTHEIPLSEEILNTQLYLGIEKARLGERLDLEFSIAPDTQQALVPSLLLQPLVENAIRHGIAPSPEGGTVIIKTERLTDRLRVTVFDDGLGTRQHAGQFGRRPQGLGLANTLERLRVLYDSNHRLVVHLPPEGGCRVELELPYNTKERGTRFITQKEGEEACAL